MAIQDSINNMIASVGAAAFAGNSIEAKQQADLKKQEDKYYENQALKGKLKENDQAMIMNRIQADTISQKNAQGDYSIEQYNFAKANNEKNLEGLRTQRLEWVNRIAQNDADLGGWTNLKDRKEYIDKVKEHYNDPDWSKKEELKANNIKNRKALRQGKLIFEEGE